MKLNERLRARLAELPKSEAPEPIREVFVSLARTTILGEKTREMTASRSGLFMADDPACELAVIGR